MLMSEYRKTLATGALLLIFCTGCSLKPTDVIQEADKALADAEAAGAPEKTPEIYKQARDHYEEGEQQAVYFRYSIARCKYKAAAREAKLAADYADKNQAPQTAPDMQCPPCPEPEAEDCCIELDLCLSDNKSLEKQLRECRGRKVVYRTRTKVIREPCPETPKRTTEEEDEPEAPQKQVLIGAFTVTGPPALQEGNTTYEVTVNYMGAHLGESSFSLQNNYDVLVDVVSVGPPDVQVMSSMMGYGPLQDGGQWPLTVYTQGEKGPVNLEVGITVKSKSTGKEFNLDPIPVKIPEAPQAKTTPSKAPKQPPQKVKVEKEIVTKETGAGWILSIGMTLAGILIGVVIGFLIFRPRSRSTLGP
jgi:hypothetical protein